MKCTVKEHGILLDILLEILQTKNKKTARQMLKFNGVRLDGVIVKRAKLEVRPGQIVEIARAEKPTGKVLAPSSGPPWIHYEDDAIIVIQKPAGLLSISTDREKNKTMHSMLYSYMQAKNGGRIYSVHRLDRNVAGIMVFSKTSQSKTDIQLNWGNASKRYVALVLGKPAKPEGRLEDWLEEVSIYKVAVTKESPRAKYSVTEYKTRETMKDKTLLDINLHTGRRHQIRVQLAHMGCPIVGDRVYGGGTLGSNHIKLFAYFLRIRHPITEKMVTFQVIPPDWGSNSF